MLKSRLLLQTKNLCSYGAYQNLCRQHHTIYYLHRNVFGSRRGSSKFKKLVYVEIKDTTPDQKFLFVSAYRIYPTNIIQSTTKRERNWILHEQNRTAADQTCRLLTSAEGRSVEKSRDPAAGNSFWTDPIGQDLPPQGLPKQRAQRHEVVQAAGGGDGGV
jgi:hypothetical protein